MSTPTGNLKDFGRNDIADHSSTDQRSVVKTNADIKHESAVNTPQCQPDLSVNLDSTATTTAHGGGLNITSTTSMNLDSPPVEIKVEPESPVQTHMEPVACSQNFYSPVYKTDTGLRSPIEDDHIKFVYPTLDRNVLSPTTGTERTSYNQLEHPAHSQMELSSHNQLVHPPLELPSFSQLAASTFMPARVGFPPLGLFPRPPLINPKPGLFTHRQPDLVPNFGIPSTFQSEFSASSHNELPVQKVLEPVSCSEPSRTHGLQALDHVNLKPALHGSPQPVLHSGYEPPTEPDPAAHSEPDPSAHSEPDPAAHSEPRPSADHTIDAKVDSMSGLFSSGDLKVFGAATPTPSRNLFELPAPAKSRKKKVSSGRAASLLMDMDFSIPGITTLTESVKQTAEAPLDLTDGVSAELPSKKNVEIGADKIYVECAAGDIDAKSAAEKVTSHPTAESLAIKQVTGIPAEKPMNNPVQSPAKAPTVVPPVVPTVVPTEAPTEALTVVPTVEPTVAPTVVPTVVPVEVTVRKKDPRGRKPKAKVNPERVTKPSESELKKKAFKTTESAGESSNTPTIKKSKRLADKQVLLKAVAEEEDRQAASISIRLVEEPTQTSGHSEKQAFGKDVSVGHSRPDANDEYVPHEDGQAAFKTLTNGRKKRAAATSVSYKDYDLDEIEEDAPRKKREKKFTLKAKEALKSFSKPAKTVVTRAKRSSGKAKEVEENGPFNVIHNETDDEVKETEVAKIHTSKSDQDNKLKRLLQSKDSKLVQINFRQLIPECLAAFTEEDKQELALLLPEPDQVIKNEKVTIRSDFGKVSTTHFYEAAEKWQDILFLGGFDPESKSATVNVEDDSFKDDNYEQHWGDRITKFNEEKRKREETDVGRPKVKKAKGKGKSSNTRRGRPRK
ncbi:hypothetical protein INT47_001582 [Mucor saturninus]|uniref:ASX DEUBAD domain-containing protein n=1 Tax=Mucor saturninus TaxID=64648 RepID=A0A8H7UXH9_9FUNG|nr:hypothetical protein INT47_001582 [Mucor saturninus]